MKLSRWKAIGGLVLAAILTAPAWGANSALPGTLNYVEGQATLGGQKLDAKSVGSVTLEPGQTLATREGKAEILLTPGVFLRVGANSVTQMVSPSLTNTEARLDKGQAMVEVAEIYKQNLLRIRSDGATTQLLKDGVYGFDADNGQVRVFKGEALVQDGDRSVKVKGGHEVDLNDQAKLQSRKFDQDSYEQSDLYRFSSLRSQYLAEANVETARIYYAGGPGWYGPGWYWDPYFTGYTWIPGSGILYSPFGWGFYSPGWAYAAPFYYRGYYPHYGYGRGGVIARPGLGAYGAGPRPAPSFHAPVARMGIMGGGFHGTGGFRR